MGEFLMACPSVPVIRGSEVRFSIDEHKVIPLRQWPLAYVGCGEITPSQPRIQWGVGTFGARYDSFTGLRLGSLRNNLTLGARSTNAGSEGAIAPAERQRVGVASLTLGGRVRFKYWNDHNFWWWPMGDDGDQGDTAGLQFSYNLGAHGLATGGWSFGDLSLTLRLATGVPNKNSGVPMGDGQVYSEVRFSDINRGDVDLHTTLSDSKARQLTLGVTVNSDAVRHAVQDRAVHRTLGIPEFPRTGQLGVMFYLRLTEW